MHSSGLWRRKRARAIAIVLSGTGSDGTNGIGAIRENEGFVIAQDLDSSKFDGMPRSAMRTGLADAQITPEEVRILAKEVLIGVTSFSRDAKFFQSLKEKVIPEIRNHSTPDEPVRARVAGCSTQKEYVLLDNKNTK